MRGLLLFGSPGRARTADLVINSHPLYQLSYRGIGEGANYTDAPFRGQQAGGKKRIFFTN